MIKKLLLLIGVYFLFTSTSTLANSCLDSLQSSNRTCQQNYSYDVLVMYFKGADNKEHKVHAKRVRQKSTGALMHVDYDFVSSCTNDCSSLDAKTNDILWAFRNAYMENKLYQKVIYKCDPTVEVCCDETGCTEIYDVDKPLDESRSSLEEIYNDHQFIQKRGSKNKDGDLIDKYIGRADGVTNIIDKVMRNSSNGQQVKQDMEAATAQPLQFQIINTVSGATKVCAVSGAYCNEIAGSATASNNMANFNLSHDKKGGAFNENLRRFLDGVYRVGNEMTCSQSTSCSSDGKNCTINMACRKY